MKCNGQVDNILITQKMADAINNYFGVEFIDKNDVGKEFFKGLKDDGEIGIYVSTVYDSDYEEIHRKFIDTNGAISSLCSSNGIIYFGEHRLNIGAFTLQFFDNSCNSGIKQIAKVDPEKAKILVGALYGWNEVGCNYDPTSSEEFLATLLKEAMGL